MPTKWSAPRRRRRFSRSVLLTGISPRRSTRRCETCYARRRGRGQAQAALPFGEAPRSAEALRSARLERAIGVIYRPQTERQSHYFRARVADQFDAVIHIDETRAVEPLERTARWVQGEVPETYPFAV